MKATVTVTIENVDWKLLRRQKQTVLDALARPGITKDDPDLDGLVNFLDHIQDQAVAAGVPEKEVFG